MGRLPTGSTLPEATIEARPRLASGRSRRPGRPSGRGLDPASRRGRPLVAVGGSGAMSADVDATIVFNRERSPAARCASESLVAVGFAQPESPTLTGARVCLPRGEHRRADRGRRSLRPRLQTSGTLAKQGPAVAQAPRTEARQESQADGAAPQDPSALIAHKSLRGEKATIRPLLGRQRRRGLASLHSRQAVAIGRGMPEPSQA
jgi:hypothetical protein